MQEWSLLPFLTFSSWLRHSVRVSRTFLWLHTTQFFQTEPYETGQCAVLMRKRKRNTQILYDHTWSGDEHLHDSMKAPEWTAEEQDMVWNDFTSLRKAHYRIVQQFCDWFKHSYTIPLKQGVGVCSRVLSNWFSRPFAMHNMTVSQHLPSRKRFRVQITFNVCWVWKLASKTPEGGLCEKHEDPSGPPIFHSLLPDWVRDRERGDEWMNQST